MQIRVSVLLLAAAIAVAEVIPRARLEPDVDLGLAERSAAARALDGTARKEGSRKAGVAPQAGHAVVPSRASAAATKPSESAVPASGAESSREALKKKHRQLSAAAVVRRDAPNVLSVQAAWTPDRLWGSGDGMPVAKRINSLHSYADSYPGRSLGNETKMSDNYNVVTASAHEWCTLTRANWACTGDAYARELNRTRPYRSEPFQLANLPPGTRIFADGNSYLAERISTMLCGFHSVDVFYLPSGNSWVVHSTKSDSTLLMFETAAASEASVVV